MTPHEAEKRVAELRDRVELWQTTKEVKLLDEVKGLQSLLDQAHKANLELTTKIQEMQTVAEHPLLKALVDFTDELVDARIAKLHQSGSLKPLPPGPDFMTVGTSKTEVTVKQLPPHEVEYDDAKLPGQILAVIHVDLTEKQREAGFKSSDLKPILLKKYGVTNVGAISAEMSKFCDATPSILYRVDEGKRDYRYFLPGNVRLAGG